MKRSFLSILQGYPQLAISGNVTNISLPNLAMDSILFQEYRVTGDTYCKAQPDGRRPRRDHRNVAGDPKKTVTADTTDVAVTCDTAAAPAVIAAAKAFRQRAGVRVRAFPTSPGLILPQLEREIQNDIIFTQPRLIDQAKMRNLVKPGGRVGP